MSFSERRQLSETNVNMIVQYAFTLMTDQSFACLGLDQTLANGTMLSNIGRLEVAARP